MIAVLYATQHGKTLTVAKHFAQELPILNANDNPDLDKYDTIVIFCPTYGDEELPFEMEDFLIQLTCKPKNFMVCELGNYYGYDDYSFGAGKIIRQLLLSYGWTEIKPIFSLDSLPQINWPNFNGWKYETLEILKNCSKSS